MVFLNLITKRINDVAISATNDITDYVIVKLDGLISGTGIFYK